ncbi:MAG: hypothetical protein LLG01_15830 [Planctomycetaceae bacterium]|nr:hypothetical protein [Planctomycetaceae bacterium]
MSSVPVLVNRLKACQAGAQHWKAFEDICTEILTYLFVPPLRAPVVQARTYSGIDRRDLVFPNRNDTGTSNWARLYRELSARMVLFEFKNYDKSDIGKDEVIQTRSYLRKAMGRLAVIVSSKMPDNSAHIRRNGIFSEDQVVILFLRPEHLEDMLYIKERGEDPSDVMMDELELFYLQHE